MSKLNTIDYDGEKMDFLVNGVPLLIHLERHEGVNSKAHIPALLSQKGTCNRLLGDEKADLEGNHVAIYLCSHCGDYDGNPIGVKIIIEDDKVFWKEIGYYSDYDDGVNEPFKKVVQFVFAKDVYKNFVERIRIYEPN